MIDPRSVQLLCPPLVWARRSMCPHLHLVHSLPLTFSYLYTLIDDDNVYIILELCEQKVIIRVSEIFPKSNPAFSYLF